MEENAVGIAPVLPVGPVPPMRGAPPADAKELRGDVLPPVRRPINSRRAKLSSYALLPWNLISADDWETLPVRSRSLLEAHYSRTAGVFYAAFCNGTRYMHWKVTPEEAREVAGAEAVVPVFNRLFRERSNDGIRMD